MVLSLPPAMLSGQVRSEPQLTFSIFGGVSWHGGIWSIPKQPLLTLFLPDQRDTLSLRRRLTSGPILGVNGTIYGGSHFGITGEIAYIGLKKDTDCETVFLNLDPVNRTNQMCDDIAGRVSTASNVSISVGGAYRFASRSAITPYVRLQGGLSVRSSSLVQVSARYTTTPPNGDPEVRERIILQDDTDVSLYPLLLAAAGATFAVSPGYSLRFEIRDHLIFLQRPTGPASDLAQVDIDTFIGHAPALIFGVDIALEKKRGRRY
jgi:hypothetical protein